MKTSWYLEPLTCGHRGAVHFDQNTVLTFLTAEREGLIIVADVPGILTAINSIRQ